MGPFLGNALFKVRYRQQWGQIAAVGCFPFLLSCFLGGKDGDDFEYKSMEMMRGLG